MSMSSEEIEALPQILKEAILGGITQRLAKSLDLIKLLAFGSSEKMELTLIVRHKDFGPRGAVLTEDSADPEVLCELIRRMLKAPKDRDPGIDQYTENGERVKHQ